MTLNYRSGQCTRCGTAFLFMSKYEYNWSVSRHLREYHDGAEPDDVMQSL